LDFLSLRRAIQQVEHDILYLNSFFSVDFAIKPLVLRRLGAINRKPIVLAPRGQFADSALALKSVKKRLFLSLGKLLGLYEGVIWQATSLHEVEDIRRIIGQNSTVMFAGVPRVDGDETAPEIVRPPKSPGTLSIALLGRIARMKNIRFALECVSRLEGKVQFDIFGPMEDERYWAECEPLVHAMPHNVTVRLQGAIPYEEVGSKLRGYHLFFLPTLGENFGHAVVDALIAGCPVLISDRTPWRDLLSRGCGWDIPLETPDAFCEILTKFVAMDEPELATLSENARRFGLEQSLRGDVLRDNWNLIRSAMDAARP
jgi:glycosyltransferase involved in cell wall biosynthesis